ncbi:MAG: threonine synthase [Candidatus Omnitrophica bacterium]|nr:threonine synthase [Candidatus Omnitrophota bacterium]MBU4478141.1 threonine synthase [Candidatus Omnitrophota bacterium]MCG2704062.1 threonine synthase [Candidatus Omnitrophota bacterium]
MINNGWQGLIKQYKAFLPVSDATPLVTLHEGNTPLIPAPSLSKLIGKNVKVFLKYEGLNPTGSFKDRGMTMAISKAKEEGSQAVMCASTGNTSASAAAYSIRAGLRCIVLIPKGAIALGKLAQALIHGACVLAVDGNFDQALTLVREITDRYPVTLVNSLNPYRIEGQKTAAFEICDVLEDAPDFLAIPVGNAGNITAYWKGFKEYYQEAKIKKLPVMLGFQAAGAAPIVKKTVIENPQTIATAIKIGNPAGWRNAEAARDESKGLIDSVTDEEILDAYKLLAGQEGVFVEPASAASVAGVLKLSRNGYFKNKDDFKVVCVLTGHGLKDPERAIKTIKEPVVIPASLEAVLDKAGIK